MDVTVRHSRYFFSSIVFLLVILLNVNNASWAQDASKNKTVNKAETEAKNEEINPTSSLAPNQPAKLIVAGKEVFLIQAQLGPYSPARRVETIQRTAKQLVRDPEAVNSISVRETAFSTDIVANNLTILTITDVDAKLAGEKSRQTLARSVAERLKLALLQDIKEHSFGSILIAAAYTAGTTILLALCLAFVGWGFPKLYTLIERARGTIIRPIRIQKTELLSQETLADVIVGVLRVLRVLVVLFLLSIYAPIVLSFFPDTRHLSNQIVNYSIQPWRDAVVPAMVSYLPNVAFMAVVIICTYYILAFTHFAFREIGRGNIVISGFDPEWSESTYKIARFLIIAFMFVMIYPYLPGSGSPAFQQVSIFVGILLSLGSTGSVSHVIAGVFLTYTGAFKIGDRVKIADTIGDVIEKPCWRLAFEPSRTNTLLSRMGWFLEATLSITAHQLAIPDSSYTPRLPSDMTLPGKLFGNCSSMRR